jgi:hypothetical protein
MQKRAAYETREGHDEAGRATYREFLLEHDITKSFFFAPGSSTAVRVVMPEGGGGGGRR